MPVAKTEQRQEARRLRRQGLSMRSIARRLGCSKSSISSWTGDIILSNHQRQRLQQNLIKGSIRQSEMRLQERLQAQAIGANRVRAGDQAFISLCLLYWGEGSKSVNSMRFTNSDEAMMCLFSRLFRECFPDDIDVCSFDVHWYPGNGLDGNQVTAYWADILGLPISALRGNRNTPYRPEHGNNPGKTPYGTCKFQCHRTLVVQQIFGGIQEFGGFERKAWHQTPKRA